MGFIDSGWQIINGVIAPPSNINPWRAYKFIQEAIYDGHLPVTRIIGYSIRVDKQKKSARSERILERDQSCADDRLTIASNLSNVLLMDYVSPRAHTDSYQGLMTVSNANFSFSKQPIIALSTKDYIVRSLEKVCFDMVLSTSTGYRDANENFEKIMKSRSVVSKTRYFPMFSYHNIIDFINVLPFVDNKIEVRYSYGMNDTYLTIMFEKLWENRTDKDWCSNYQEILI